MALLNKTKFPVTLHIVDTNGKKDTVNLQPAGRIDTLPSGFMLDRDFEKIHAEYVRDTNHMNVVEPNNYSHDA